MRSRTLRIIAVLAVISLLILTLQYIHLSRTSSLVVFTRHQEKWDAINMNVELCANINDISVQNVNRNLTTYNAGTFTSTLQRIVVWTIICVHSSVTPWPKSSDIFISVKTTFSNHESRLSLLLTTWMQRVHAKQIHIVTDTGGDKWTQMANSMGMSTIISDCPVSHAKWPRPSQWCKSGFEFEQYYAKREHYRWFCHFDDDTYVNIPVLVKTLQQYNPERERLYLGHMPILYYSSPRKWKNLRVASDKLQRYFPEHKGNASALYYYAGGAAYCFSSSLMAEMEIYIRDNKTFYTTCSRIHLPDDVVLGTITSVILGYNLTEVPLMQTHIEALEDIPSQHLKDYITLGYLYSEEPRRGIVNRVNVSHARFSTEEDPTRFLSYHCLLFPETSWCRKS